MKRAKIIFGLILLTFVVVASIKPVFGAQIEAVKKRFLEVLVVNEADQPIPVEVQNQPTPAPVQINIPIPIKIIFFITPLYFQVLENRSGMKMIKAPRQ